MRARAEFVAKMRAMVSWLASAALVAAATAALAIALVWPLDAMGERLFRAHMLHGTWC